MSNHALTLRLELLGDAIFGRGDGVAGLVDTDVEHDDLGLPYLHGRGVKGLLRARCSEVLGALNLALPGKSSGFESAAEVLFGMPGSGLTANGKVAFGPARLPDELARALEPLLLEEKPRLRREDVLNALTGIRRQTMIAEDGAAADKTLRSARILRRGLIFHAPIYSDEPFSSMERGLLAACSRAVRHIGSHRARGLGEARISLWQAGQDVTLAWMGDFEKELQ